MKHFHNELDCSNQSYENYQYRIGIFFSRWQMIYTLFSYLQLNMKAFSKLSESGNAVKVTNHQHKRVQKEVEPVGDGRRHRK